MVKFRVVILLPVAAVALALASCSHPSAMAAKVSTSTTLHSHVIVALSPPDEYLKLAAPADQAEAAFDAVLMGSDDAQLDGTAGSLADALLQLAKALRTYIWPNTSAVWVGMLIADIPPAAAVLKRISLDGLQSVTSNAFATDTARVDADCELLRQVLGLPPVKPVKPTTPTPRLPTFLV